MKPLLLILALSFSLFTQDSRLNVKYDRIEDRTNVSTKQIYLKKSGLTMVAYFNHQGTKLTEPVKKAGLIFYSHSDRWEYLQTSRSQLFVLADGERFSPLGPNRKSEVLRDSTVSEQLIFQLTDEQLDQIAKASKVEMKLGSETFTLGSDTIEGLRQLRAAMNPR